MCLGSVDELNELSSAPPIYKFEYKFQVKIKRIMKKYLRLDLSQ
jgi:hypothetical protein